MPSDQFSARWVGKHSFNAGTYEFKVTADDGIRLWVDGQLLIDQWKDQAPTTYTASVSLTAGEHEVKTEYYENGGGAVARVSWAQASTGTAPLVALDSATSLPLIERDLCLTIAAGSNAAYECGDLRLVHALPTVRTYNKARTPVLLYNSQHAEPKPLIAMDVGIRGDAPNGLQEIRATVQINGSSFTQQWTDASQWPKGQTRRVVVSHSFLDGLATGVYPYEVTVAAVYGGTPYPAATRTGHLVVVNRKQSPFGAGWWVAGLERLHMHLSTENTLVWEGGDGSVRVYTRVPGESNTWAAPSLDRPDRIQKNGSGEYERLLPGGVKVVFNFGGQHVATINRLQHRTSFDYDGSGRLWRIRVPVPSGTEPSYVFSYPSTTSVQISAPALALPGGGQEARDVVLTLSGTRVTQIRDPDQTTVGFEYTEGSNRITDRIDRRQTRTSYGYDAGKKVGQSTIHMAPVTDNIVTTIRSKESRGVAGPVVPDSVYTVIDGPRRDVNDYTRFWLNGLGAPWKVKNALGDSTVVTRGDARWPALATEVRAPNGLITKAWYNARGNTDGTTVVNPYGDGRNAVTRHAHDNAQWPDFVTRTEQPEGEVTEIGYDSWGNRVWQQTGPKRALTDGLGYAAHVDTTRATFHYDAQNRYTHTCTPVQRSAGCGDGFRAGQEWTAYDALGNVEGTRTPIGFWTAYERDNLGREVKVFTPIDSAQALSIEHVKAYGQRQTIIYKPRTDLVQRTETYGAGRTYQRVQPGTTNATINEETEALTLVVENGYDNEGHPLQVERRSEPDLAGAGTVTTRYRYDPAGRRVAEESTVDASGLGAVDSTVYDPAGNVREAHTRRGLISMEYDELGRLLKRSSTAGVDTFRYDVMGRMTVADNPHARIRRSYFPGGALRADTQTIVMRDTAVVEHTYGLRFGYDLDGRRTRLYHPTNLAPAGTDVTSYRYDDATGRLLEVTGELGGGTYHYDRDGQLRGRNIDVFTYDADGRLKEHQAGGQSAVTLRYDARAKVVGASGNTVDLEELVYSGLGHLALSRRANAEVPQEEYRTDALGNLAWKRVTKQSGVQWPDSVLEVMHRYNYTPGTGRLARIEARAPQFTPLGTPWGPDSILSYQNSDFVYNRAGDRGTESERTGTWHDSRSTQPSGTGMCGPTRGFVDGTRTSQHNVLGQVTRQAKSWGQYTSVEVPAEAGGTHPCPGAAYGQLPEQGWQLGTPRTYALRSVYDDFGYDALGRRVWVKTQMNREHCAGTAWPGGPPLGLDVDHCDNSVRRVVWDGDRLLWETRYPDMVQDSGLDARNREARRKRDAGEKPGGGLNTSKWAQHGRVAYTHGIELDQPLSVGRLDYSYDLPGLVVLQPSANWKGHYIT
ncbi:MAG: PA14 domain-containing protein, partial [Gemmatimonadota bacterium]|nr:PA14 domain-containing protein [Gemmatimonadota bacterium]